MAIVKMNKEKKEINIYLGQKYIVRELNIDGTFVVDIYDIYQNENIELTTKLRTRRANARFTRGIKKGVEVGTELFQVEAMAVKDARLGKQMQIISAFDTYVKRKGQLVTFA